MPRKIAVIPLRTQNYELMVSHKMISASPPDDWSWHVRDLESCADTKSSTIFDDYRTLKKIWRTSREDFDSACRFMKFNDLFSTAGIEL